MGLDSLPMNLSNKLAIWLPWTPETPRNHLDVWGKTLRDNVVVTQSQAVEYINMVRS